MLREKILERRLTLQALFLDTVFKYLFDPSSQIGSAHSPVWDCVSATNHALADLPLTLVRVQLDIELGVDYSDTPHNASTHSLVALTSDLLTLHRIEIRWILDIREA